MPRDPRKYLHDVIDAIDFLGRIPLKGLESYLADDLLRAAAGRKLMIAGEALFQLSKSAPHLLNGISECDQIIGFRHVLVHAYFQLDHNLVWNILQEKLSTLRTEVVAALAAASTLQDDGNQQ